MKNITSLINSNRIYFTGFSALLVTCSLFLIFQGKNATFIPLDAYHPVLLNVFFINYTFMGNVIFAISLIAVFFIYYGKKQQAYALLSSLLISGFIIQVLKNLVNASVPKLYIETGTYLHFNNGAALATDSGSVSAHTATAFAIATVLALMIKNKKMQWLIVVAAAGVGFSRMYLAGHFLIDIIAGAATGTVSGLIGVYLVTYKLDLKRSFTQLHSIRKKTVSTPADIQTATG